MVVVGLTIANAYKMAQGQPRKWRPWIFSLVTFAAVGALRWPLVAVMPWRVSLNLHEHDGAQTLRATFDARSYDPDAVRRFAGRLMAFVDEASREPGAPLRKLLEPSALPG